MLNSTRLMASDLFQYRSYRENGYPEQYLLVKAYNVINFSVYLNGCFHSEIIDLADLGIFVPGKDIWPHLSEERN